MANEINRIKTHTDLPVCVGFGIKTPEDAKVISIAADGVVVGSAIIEKILVRGQQIKGVCLYKCPLTISSLKIKKF